MTANVVRYDAQASSVLALVSLAPVMVTIDRAGRIVIPKTAPPPRTRTTHGVECR